MSSYYSRVVCHVPLLMFGIFQPFFLGGGGVRAPSAQLVECLTLDSKVAGSNFTRGAVLCP